MLYLGLLNIYNLPLQSYGYINLYFCFVFTKQVRYGDPMMVQCCANACDAGPPLKQHRFCSYLVCFNPCGAGLFLSIFHSFEAVIYNAISSCKNRNNFIFMNKINSCRIV